MAYDINIKYTAEFLRETNWEDLEILLKEAQQRYLELREQSSAGGRVKIVRKPHLFGKVKKDIARIRTLLREGSCW